jgi:hypothetical protein
MCLREQPACIGGSNFQQPAQNFILQSNEAMPWGVAGSGHTSGLAAIWTTSARWLRVYALLMGLGSA